MAVAPFLKEYQSLLYILDYRAVQTVDLHEFSRQFSKRRLLASKKLAIGLAFLLMGLFCYVLNCCNHVTLLQIKTSIHTLAVGPITKPLFFVRLTCFS